MDIKHAFVLQIAKKTSYYFFCFLMYFLFIFVHIHISLFTYSFIHELVLFICLVVLFALFVFLVYLLLWACWDVDTEWWQAASRGQLEGCQAAHGLAGDAHSWPRVPRHCSDSPQIRLWAAEHEAAAATGSPEARSTAAAGEKSQGGSWEPAA